MQIEIIQLDYITDRIRGIRKHMQGYVTGIICEYLGHKLYQVELDGYGWYHVWDWQVKAV